MFPIGGAVVTIYQGGTSKGTATTDALGFYSKSITINEAGTFPFLANALGVYSNVDYITITEPGPYVNRVTISAPSSADENESFTITGRVTDQYGAGMAGVTVYLQRDGASIGSDATNSTGYYSKSHSIPSAGTHMLGATADGLSAFRSISITEPEPPPGEPYGVIDDFTVPESLPAGSDVNVRVLMRNAGDASGYVTFGIDGNPDSPDSYRMVEAGATPVLAPGASVWMDVYFRYDKMPSWDFNLTAFNDDGTSRISRVILVGEVPVGIPTTTTMSAPDRVGVDELFDTSGNLYETESGIPIPDQTISLSFMGPGYTRGLGNTITGVDGDYLIQGSLPRADIGTLVARFAGTEALQPSRSQVDSVVVTSPLEAAIAIISAAATGLALFIYGTGK